MIPERAITQGMGHLEGAWVAATQTKTFGRIIAGLILGRRLKRGRARQKISEFEISVGEPNRRFGRISKPEVRALYILLTTYIYRLGSSYA